MKDEEIGRSSSSSDLMIHIRGKRFDVAKSNPAARRPVKYTSMESTPRDVVLSRMVTDQIIEAATINNNAGGVLSVARLFNPPRLLQFFENKTEVNSITGPSLEFHNFWKRSVRLKHFRGIDVRFRKLIARTDVKYHA